MSEYIINGGNKVEGTIEISGSKNASLPIIAATILNAGKTTLYNVPHIHDTKIMFEILEKELQKSLKDEDFCNLVKRNKLPRDITLKNNTKLMDTCDELKNCKTCK